MFRDDLAVGVTRVEAASAEAAEALALCLEMAREADQRTGLRRIGVGSSW